MYQLQMNDRVRHPSVDATLTVKSIEDGRVECAWIDKSAIKMGVFDAEELDYAPESIKALAKAAVRNGFAGAAQDAAAKEPVSETS